MIDPEVHTILEAVPEFAARFVDLVEEMDGDPGGAAAFEALADFAAELALAVDRFSPVLERTMAGIEAVAGSSPDAEELVGWAFLDSLSPDDLRRLGPWTGPATRRLIDTLELPEPPAG